jgi:hypothetical protein
MWNSLTMVAENQFLPESEFVSFAEMHVDKYRIDVSNPKRPEVGTFWVDALIKDFRNANPELCARTRNEKIAELRERNKINNS